MLRTAGAGPRIQSRLRSGARPRSVRGLVLGHLLSSGDAWTSEWGRMHRSDRPACTAARARHRHDAEEIFFSTRRVTCTPGKAPADLLHGVDVAHRARPDGGPAGPRPMGRAAARGLADLPASARALRPPGRAASGDEQQMLSIGREFRAVGVPGGAVERYLRPPVWDSNGFGFVDRRGYHRHRSETHLDIEASPASSIPVRDVLRLLSLRLCRTWKRNAAKYWQPSLCGSASGAACPA